MAEGITLQPDVSCRFNEAIQCSDRGKCAKCGWNPSVTYERRVQRIRKAIREEMTNNVLYIYP